MKYVAFVSIEMFYLSNRFDIDCDVFIRDSNIDWMSNEAE